MPEKTIFDTIGRKGIRVPSGMLEGVQARVAAEKQNWQQYLSFTPKDGGEYYTLSIPVGVEPPQENDRMVLDGVNVVVFFISTPEEIEKGRGGPVARFMRENGIAYRVNCLPEGHERLQRKTSKTAADRLLFPGQEKQEHDPSHDYKLGGQSLVAKVDPAMVAHRFASETVGKCKVILPPEKFDLKAEDKMSVFLAGAIDMGAAEDWQKETTEYLSDVDCVVLNPRRKDWDSTWKQEMENPQFREQVEWELKGLEEVDLIALCYTKDSKAPISLLEMGLHIGDGRLIVFCPEGYWRKGNVDIVCARYGVQVLSDWTDFKKEIHRRMSKPSTIGQTLRAASDRIAWRILAKEFVMQMHTASKIKVGDICDVDMDEVNDLVSEDVDGPWIRKIFLLAQRGNVRVNKISGENAVCVPESFNGTGGVAIPMGALKVVKTSSETDPMAGEKLTRLVMQFDRWTEELLDERSMSSPVSVQIMEGRIAVRKKLQGKMGLTGTAAVKAMAEAMRKNFTFDAAPFPSLVRKYGREVIYDIFHSLTGGMGDTQPFGSSPLSRRPDYGVRDGEISETNGLKLPSEGIMTSSDNMRVQVITDRIVASAKIVGIE